MASVGSFLNGVTVIVIVMVMVSNKKKRNGNGNGNFSKKYSNYTSLNGTRVSKSFFEHKGLAICLF
jgi:hypothetical protein